MKKLLTKYFACIVLIALTDSEIGSAQIPTVTSVSPNAAHTGTSVTITGTNFNTTPANNIVYFGATRATVTASGATIMTATVPTGATYDRVSVNNTASGRTGNSQYPFLPTFNNSAFEPGTVNLATQVTYTAGSRPLDISICDIDGDGKPDMVALNYYSNTVSVYRNTSSIGSITSSSFAIPISFYLGGDTIGSGAIKKRFAVGDLDGDGKPDLAVTGGISETVSVFRNTSSSGSITASSFATPVTFATGNYPQHVAIGDLNGDGRPEIVVANTNDYTVSVFRNTSSSGSITSSSFAPKVTYASGSCNQGLAIGDIDGDGKHDIVVTNACSLGNAVSVLRNIHVPEAFAYVAFASRVTFATLPRPFDVAISDIDGDGKQDMVVTNYGDQSVSVYRNTSSSGSITSSSFASRVTFATGTQPTDVAIGDINGDGKPDLAVTNSGSNTVSVLLNTSSSGSITLGSFALHVPFNTGSLPQKTAIGDIDGDGKPDLAVANFWSDNISVLRNNPLRPITGPKQVCVGSTTTLLNATTGGTWSSSNTARATVGASTGIVTGVSAGTVIVTYAGTAGASFAGNRVTRAYTVNVLPEVAVISGASSLFAGTTLTLTASPSGGTWSSANSAIASVNASTGVVTGVAAGITTVSYTRTNSCGNRVTTKAVTVTAPPITGTRVVCRGATTNLANASVGGTWSTANGTIATVGSTTGVVTGVGAGTTTVTYTYIGGSNVTATVTVNAAPAAYTGSGILCSSSQLNLGSIIPGCTWTSSNTTRATVASTTGIVTGGTTLGTVNISYTNAASCRTITQLTVTAAVGFTTGLSSPCVGSTSTALNSTPGGTWSSSNLARATIGETSGLLTAISGGTATISYTLSAGCVRTTTVTVGTPPTITGNPNICLGQQTLFVSTGGTWSSSAPTIASVAASGFVTGVSLGNAVITYRSTSGALCFVTQPVTVNPVPSTIVAPPAICPGQTVTLTSTPSGGTWTSSFPEKASINPSTGVLTGVIFNYSTISAVNIYYTLPTGCAGLATVSVNPLPSPIGGGSRNICVLGSTTLTNSTSGGTWSSASPSLAAVSSGGVVTGGTSAGLATISYTNALGCANTAVVTVNAMPGANTGAATLCLPGVTTLSNPAGAGTWTSGNTARATVNFNSGQVTGVNTGTANITYTKAAGCISVTQVTVSMCGSRPGMSEDTKGDNSVFTVSPNPTTGAINLTTDVAGKVMIYTIDGKELKQYDAKVGTTNMALPAGIATGVYMLRFNGADGSSKMVRLVYQQ